MTVTIHSEITNVLASTFHPYDAILASAHSIILKKNLEGSMILMNFVKAIFTGIDDPFYYSITKYFP